MARMNRKDRVLLEDLNTKYGSDLMANAIIAIANSKDENGNIPEPTRSREDIVLDFIRFIEGARIRFRELHWELERNAEHKLTDDIISELESVEDNIAEDFMGVVGYRIKVGQLVPFMPKSSALEPCLDETLTWCKTVKECISDDSSYDGIVNEIDDLIHFLRKSKFLSTMK